MHRLTHRLNEDKRHTRRYHWHSEGLSSFLQAPHSAINGPAQGEIANLTDKRAAPSRDAQLELLADLGPDSIVREYMAMNERKIVTPAGGVWHAATVIRVQKRLGIS